VAAQSGLPLRRAQVMVVASDSTMRRVTTTDGEGRYEFIELPAGRFSVTATKAGYVSLQYGQRRPFEPGTPITITDDATVERIDFALPSGGVIIARVTDDFGEPLAGAQIQVHRFQYGPDGQRRLAMAPSGVGMFLSTTDDRGELRVYGLMPGEYVVSATVRSRTGLAATAAANPNDANEGFSPTFYPGTVSATEAHPVSLAVGEERSVQFAMVAARLSRITGTAINSEGQPAAGAMVTVSTRQASGVSSGGGGTVAEDGSFTIADVAPGEHSIEVRPRVLRGESGGEFASVPIVVSGADITGLRIVTSKGATVSGRVAFEGTSPRNTTSMPAPPRVMVTPADSSTPILGLFMGDQSSNGTLDDSGNFRVAAGWGRVFITMIAPPAWAIKSVTLDGTDITDEPLELTGKQSVGNVVITLTDKLTRISGRVNDGRGRLLDDYVVVIQPAEPKEPPIASRWIRAVRPDKSGRFETRGMRPGRYVATAIETLEQGRQFAPEFQQQLRRGAREFSVGEGESVTLDLQLTSGL
jgi:protocatechuate 3,4-dioxygenase beta subunit